MIFSAGCGKDKDDDVKRKPAAAAEQKQPDNDDGPGVTLKKEVQERAGIRMQPLALQSIGADLAAYGKLEADPSGSFVVRAPFAGTLQAAAGHPWPSLGQTLPAGDRFGRIEPRLTLTDRIGLNTQLTTARAEWNANRAAVSAAQTAYDRMRALNADNKNVSDRAVQEAKAVLAAAQAREAGSQAAVHLLETSLSGGPASGSGAVTVERGGDVVEVLAQPGESIEQGSPILRIARFDRMLARIDLPLGEQVPAGGATARIVPAGFENQPPLPAQRVAVTGAIDGSSQGITLLYRLLRSLPGLRPGVAVTAHLAVPGPPGKGILIPQSAIVQQDGRPWVYVQTKPDRFTRRPVPIDLPGPDGFIASRGFAAGERIVVTGAQSLLSEEFKSSNDVDTN